MPDDMRWRLGTVSHPKILRLVSACGERAFRALVTLWEYAATHRQDGRLLGMDHPAIHVAAGWPEAPETFVPTLVAVRLLDTRQPKSKRTSARTSANAARISAHFVIHDWPDNQPWIVGAKKRSRKAMKAAEIRWEKRHAPSIETDAPSNAGSNARGNAPSDRPTKKNSDPERVRASAGGAAPAGGEPDRRRIPKPKCGGGACMVLACCEDSQRNRAVDALRTASSEGTTVACHRPRGQSLTCGPRGVVA